MDKSQALYNFWSSFQLPAYDQLTVPDNAQMPYITYENITDSIGTPISLSASLWYHSTRWDEISVKAEEIAERIAKYGHNILKIDGGYIFITKASPFSQRMSDDSDSMIRRIFLNISAEFLTAY